MKKVVGVGALILGCAFPAVGQQDVEGLHFSTSGGAAAAPKLLRSTLDRPSIHWNEMPLAGGGGAPATMALRSRVAWGNPPAAVLLASFNLAKAGVTGEPKTCEGFIAEAHNVRKRGSIATAPGGQPAGSDYPCFPVPGTQGSVPFLSNYFTMFHDGAGKVPAQSMMAFAGRDPEVQSAFNVCKGAMPARSALSDAASDACGERAMKDLSQTSRNNTLIGSIAQDRVSPAEINNSFYDFITCHLNGQLDDAIAVAALASAARI